MLNSPTNPSLKNQAELTLLSLLTGRVKWGKILSIILLPSGLRLIASSSSACVGGVISTPSDEVVAFPPRATISISVWPFSRIAGSVVSLARP